MEQLITLMIPFFGTMLGSASVFFLKGSIPQKTQKALLGFASGVMIAASVWSLLIPSLEMAEEQGGASWVPAAVGFLLGIGFLLLMDELIPHLHVNSEKPEGLKSGLSKSTMLLLAVTLHNIPEGMAVGVAFAGASSGGFGMSATAALALSLGIAMQNFPEGAIISMPLKAEGMSKFKAFIFGTLSGAVEPVAAFLTVLFAGYAIAVLPYLLAFAAGAMIYVVIEELIPEAQAEPHSNIGTIAAALGFVIMMVLDVTLG